MSIALCHFNYISTQQSFSYCYIHTPKLTCRCSWRLFLFLFSLPSTRLIFVSFLFISLFRTQISYGRPGQCGQNNNLISISNERSGAHQPNHRFECRGNRLEKYPLFGMGFSWWVKMKHDIFHIKNVLNFKFIDFIFSFIIGKKEIFVR